MEDSIKRELNESILVKRSILERNIPDIIKLVEMVIYAYRNGGRLVAFGNGGSAADAQHIIAELVNYQYNPSRPMLDALALTVNSSIITSIGNDLGYDYIFSRQIESLVNSKDVALGITTSGNSKNVILGLKKAKENGAKCVAFVGKEGGKVKDLDLDILIKINSDDTARIQEGHITIGHIMCSLIEKELFQDRKIKFVSEETPSVSSTIPVRLSLGNGGDTDDYIKKVGGGCVLNVTLKSHYYKCSLILRKIDTILVNIRNIDGNEFDNYEIKELKLKNDKADLIRATLKRVYPGFKGDIIIETNVPPTSGLGGSSSLNVALIESLYKLKGKKYSPEEVARLAYKIEREDLNIKGGYQDQWAAAYRKGINFMEFNVNGIKVNRLNLDKKIVKKLEQNIVLSYLGPRLFSGSEVHKSQIKESILNPRRIKEILLEKKDNVVHIKDALLKGDLDKFGELLHREFVLKKMLSPKVTTDHIEKIYESVLSNGALGGKISGAGGGGCAFFYCPRNTKRRVIKCLKEKGTIIMPLEFETTE